MIIKRYLGNTMNEIMSKIKLDLGKEAVIVNQRKIRKPGFKGYFSSKVIEVTAAIDNKEEIFNPPPIFPKDRNLQEDKTLEILKEIQDLKNSIYIHNNQEIPIKTILEDNDVPKELIEDMFKRAQEENLLKGDPLKVLSKLIKPYLSISTRELKGNIVFVGPTGVGKTTTIAKLAGKLALKDKKKVGLITVDTYRIGAIDQLKTYAEIMNLPFKVVVTLKEMEEAIKEMSSCDVVLIDTTGRSSKNTMQISELRAFVEKTKSKDIHLVISSVTKNRDVEKIIKAYKELSYTRLIVTKLDETGSYGMILPLTKLSEVPISFITTGQNVPEDIMVPNKDKLVKLILGEEAVC